MKPLRTASTTTALRRATHRFVSVGGNTGSELFDAGMLPRFGKRSITGTCR
jgi:hypothetical protein